MRYTIIKTKGHQVQKHFDATCDTEAKTKFEQWVRMEEKLEEYQLLACVARAKLSVETVLKMDTPETHDEGVPK